MIAIPEGSPGATTRLGPALRVIQLPERIDPVARVGDEQVRNEVPRGLRRDTAEFSRAALELLEASRAVAPDFQQA